MSDDQAAYQRLAEQFPTDAHKRVKKGGREQTYIPWTDKVDRFNKVLGQDWSFRVIREGLTDTEAWVLGELSVTIDGVATVRQQYGCEPIVKGQRETPTTDLFKIAGTDAFSKAATLFGCGLYRSIQEERAEVEAAMQAAIREANRPQQRPQPAQTGKPAGPTPLHDADRTAVLTGAPNPPRPAGYFCIECHGLVKTDGEVSVPKKKKDGSIVRVSVPVADFAPVCEERLGGFHCPGCYEKKWFGAA
jgi:hypothetical protein